MRVFFRGLGSQADFGKKPLHPLLPLCCIRCAKVAQRLGHDLTRRQARTQGRIGILKNDLHVAPAQAHLVGVQRQQFFAIELDRARCRLDQPQHRLGGGGLAAAGLSHQGQGFTARQRERNPVDRLDRRLGRTEPVPGCDEVLAQLAYFKQQWGAHAATSAWLTRPSSTAKQATT